ncbi:MAG: alpha/beta fold hydrolase [Myxococcota bacterium]
MPTVSGPPAGIHYEVTGPVSAPPLVALRGLARSLRHWPDAFLDAVQREMRLILIDNRGVGRSEPVATPYTTEDMAGDVVRVLDHAGIDRVHLFGMSLGGMIGQWVAIRHPDRVRRLVLGCTSPGGPASERAQLSVFVSLARARFADETTRAEVEARYLLGDPQLPHHRAIIDRWAELAREAPVPRATAMLQLLAAARHRALDELGAVRARTLLLSSEIDAMVPPANSRLLARRIRHAELQWLPGAAHDFVSVVPDETARLVLDFCRDAEP